MVSALRAKTSADEAARRCEVALRWPTLKDSASTAGGKRGASVGRAERCFPAGSASPSSLEPGPSTLVAAWHGADFGSTPSMPAASTWATPPSLCHAAVGFAPQAGTTLSPQHDGPYAYMFEDHSAVCLPVELPPHLPLNCWANHADTPAGMGIRLGNLSAFPPLRACPAGTIGAMRLAAEYGHDHSSWAASWNGGYNAAIRYMELPGKALSWNLKSCGNQNFPNCRFCGRLVGCLGDHVMTKNHIKAVWYSICGTRKSGGTFSGSEASDPHWSQWAPYPGGWHGFHHLSGFYCRMESTPPAPAISPCSGFSSPPPPPPLQVALV